VTVTRDIIPEHVLQAEQKEREQTKKPAYKADCIQSARITSTTSSPSIKLVHKHQRTTRYTIKNNNAQKTIQRLYIDHTADHGHGGYSILTQTHAIKSTTNFSRY